MIDRGNDQPWPDAVTGKLSAFRQGSLVESPPFAYHASTAHPLWVASRMIEPGSDPVELVELDLADRPPFGIITTQSCDVDEEGRNKKPWVQVAPVYELPGDDPGLGMVRSWKVHYLAPVTSQGPSWVADLRIELPVEKGWLVSRTPIDAFETAEELQKFSEHCGRYRSRQGVATSVYDDLLTPLEYYLRDLRQTDQPLFSAFTRDVEHLFLDIAGDPLAPRTVQLIFVSPNPLEPTLVERLEAWWEDIVGGARPPAFNLLPNRYLRFADVHFADSRTWREQDLARLNASS